MALRLCEKAPGQHSPSTASAVGGFLLLVHSEDSLRWSRLSHARGVLIVVFAFGVSLGINAFFYSLSELKLLTFSL